MQKKDTASIICTLLASRTHKIVILLIMQPVFWAGDQCYRQI